MADRDARRDGRIADRPCRRDRVGRVLADRRARPLDASAIEAIPVDFVEIGDGDVICPRAADRFRRPSPCRRAGRRSRRRAAAAADRRRRSPSPRRRRHPRRALTEPPPEPPPLPPSRAAAADAVAESRRPATEAAGLPRRCRRAEADAGRRPSTLDAEPRSSRCSTSRGRRRSARREPPPDYAGARVADRVQRCRCPDDGERARCAPRPHRRVLELRRSAGSIRPKSGSS